MRVGRCKWESGMRSSFVPFIYLSTIFCHEFVAKNRRRPRWKIDARVFIAIHLWKIRKKNLHISCPPRKKNGEKNGWMIVRKPGPCLRDMLIWKTRSNGFCLCFCLSTEFFPVINAANKGNKFDSIEIIFKRGTKWELFPSKELDFSVFEFSEILCLPMISFEK